MNKDTFLRQRVSFRMGKWSVLTLLLALPIFYYEPQQFMVFLWFLLKITAGAYLGYWLDRSLFPGQRPHSLSGQLLMASWLRRTIIVSSVILAIGTSV